MKSTCFKLKTLLISTHGSLSYNRASSLSHLSLITGQGQLFPFSLITGHRSTPSFSDSRLKFSKFYFSIHLTVCLRIKSDLHVGLLQDVFISHFLMNKSCIVYLLCLDLRVHWSVKPPIEVQYCDLISCFISQWVNRFSGHSIDFKRFLEMSYMLLVVGDDTLT